MRKQEMWFSLTAANKTGLGGTWLEWVMQLGSNFPLQHSDEAAQQLRHFVGGGCFQKLDSSQNRTLHSHKNKIKIQLFPTYTSQAPSFPVLLPPSFPPSLSQPVSLWHAEGRRREELHTILHAQRDRNVHRRSSPPSTHVTGCWLVVVVRGAWPPFRCDFFCLPEYQMGFGKNLFLYKKKGVEGEMKPSIYCRANTSKLLN